MPTTYYHYDLNGEVIEETDDNGNTIVEYTREPDGTLISERRNGVDRQYHFDADGNTLALTDDSGNITDTFAYNASGEVTERTGTTPTRYQSHGEQGYCWDDNLGTFHVGQRVLDPSQSRWLSADPLEFIDGPNRYRYARNNPVTRFDPSGLFSELGNMVEFPFDVDDPGDECAAAKKTYCVYKITKVEPTEKTSICFGFLVGDIMCNACPPKKVCDNKMVREITENGKVVCTLEVLELNKQKCVACPPGAKDGIGGSPVK